MIYLNSIPEFIAPIPVLGYSSLYCIRGRSLLKLNFKSYKMMEERFTGKKKNIGFALMESSSSGTAKRSRAHSCKTQVPSCLVDGCNSDLSKCRDYHRRHKVCELHSKSPKVTIGGQERRFCQQCSRFHSLIEFDEGKRSCRKRLDGHNRRRRKPQPESVPLNSGRFLSSYQDSKFFPFGIPQLISTSAAVSSVWDGTVKAENDTSSQSLLSFAERRKSSPSSSILSFKGKQFPFLHDSSRDPAIPEASIRQSFLEPSYGSKNRGNGQRVYFDGLNRVIDSDRTRALSLLSTPAETQEIYFSSMVQHSLNPPRVQSLVPNVHYNGLGMEDKDLNSALISDERSRNTNNIQQCEGTTFQIGADGSSSSGGGPYQTLSFWE